MFPVLAGSNPSGYNLTRSVRLRSSATANLTRTFSSAGNRRTWTWSGWVKIGAISGSRAFFAANASASAIGFDTNNGTYEIFVDGVYNGTRTLRYTASFYRDPAAWYHIVFALDTTQATDTNRIKLYVNGSQVSLTNVAVGSWPAQNSDGSINNNIQHCIGQRIYTTDYNFDGYLTEVNFIDGQALTPSSFGSTNTLTGVWQPARYTGTYGTNGFYLPFTDNSALTTSSNVGLGKDFSGNGNYWTTNNISITSGATYDSMTDVPTLTSATAANFAVLNPLQNKGTLASANLNYVAGGGSTNYPVAATIGAKSGKLYWEVKVTSLTTYLGVGVLSQADVIATIAAGDPVGQRSSSYCVYQDGYKANNASSTAYIGSSFATGDVIGVALDLDNGKIWFAKNNTFPSSGDPAAGTNPAFSSMPSDTYFPALSGLSCTLDINFGQRPFAYTPPTGFVALNTFNLPTSTIVKGNTVMDATLYTGTNATLSVTNAGAFKPDLVWIKGRSQSSNNVLQDSVRGANRYLSSNSTAAEGTDGSLTSFNSNGFSLTTDPGVSYNANGTTYVGWQWQAGQGTTSSNTSGTITSSVSVNASAGFSVVTYTAQASGTGTVGHGLGVAPSLIITKPRANAYGWTSYHASLGNTQYIELNTTSAAATNSTVWNNTSPTSSVFTLGSAYAGNGTYVAYCWTPIAGYSAFGSYTGNGSTDGPFVYTGFRPKFVIIKRTDTTGDWYTFDAVRSPYNATQQGLSPNSSDAETTYTGWGDLLSNGFKIRRTDGAWNASGGGYIYMAFAENPLKNSLAR